jgi:hypothetical protein
MALMIAVAAATRLAGATRSKQLPMQSFPEEQRNHRDPRAEFSRREKIGTNHS